MVRSEGYRIPTSMPLPTPAADTAGHCPARKLQRPILVSLRDTGSDAHDVRLDRFRLIDSDFA